MLLRHVVSLVADKGYRVGNVDVTIIAQAPKMAPHIADMRAVIAADLQVRIDDVNVKELMVAIHEYRDHAGIAVSLLKDILSKKLQWSRDLIIEKLRSQDITVGKLAFGKTRQEQALEIFDLEIMKEVPAHITEKVDFTDKKIDARGYYDESTDTMKVETDLGMESQINAKTTDDALGPEARVASTALTVLDASSARVDVMIVFDVSTVFCTQNVTSEKCVLEIENRLVFGEDSRATTDISLLILTEQFGPVPDNVIGDTHQLTDLDITVDITEATHDISLQRYAVWRRGSVSGHWRNERSQNIRREQRQRRPGQQ